MKEAFWGVLIVILGLFGIVVVNVFQNITVDNDRTYYQIKESTEAAAFDALDLTHYRLNGTLRIVEDKFVENLTRRFAENISKSNYKITVEDVNEMPPKVSLRVETGVGIINTGLFRQDDPFNIVNRVDAILETKYTVEDLEFIGITKEEWGEKLETDPTDNVCKPTIGDVDAECIDGDIKFAGDEEINIQNKICIGQVPPSNVNKIVNYKVCECGKWVDKTETLVASPRKQGSEWIYEWTFYKEGKNRVINQVIRERILELQCTNGIQIYVPDDIDEKNQNNVSIPYQPSSDNSRYEICPPEGIKIPIGMAFVAHPNYLPANSVNRNLIWKSSDSSILGVVGVNPSRYCDLNSTNSNCFSTAKVTTNKLGTTYINVETTQIDGTTPRGQKATCKVEVYNGKVDSIGCKDLSVEIEESAVVVALPKPANATIFNYTYKIANTSIAKLSGNKVTGVASGTTTLTITETNTGKTGTCTIKVPWPPLPPDVPRYGSSGDGGTTTGSVLYVVKDKNGNVIASSRTSYANAKARAEQEAAKDKTGVYYVYSVNETSGKSTKIDATLTSGNQMITNTYNGQPTVQNTKSESYGSSSKPSSGGGGGSSGGGGGGGSSSSGSSSNKGSSSSSSSGRGSSNPSYSSNRGSSSGSSSRPSSGGGGSSNKGSSSSSKGSSCLAEGTKIKLANGNYKNVEDIDYNDLLMVWNYETGNVTYEYPIWIEKEGNSNTYINIKFNDGTYLNIVEDHGIYDIEKQHFVNIDDLKIGSSIAKIVDDKVKKVEIVSIEKIEKETKYYHIVSTRYYNVIANDVLTTDYIVLLSNFRGFNRNVTWKTKKYNNNQLYSYDELSYLPNYLFKGFRAEEAKTFESYLDKDGFKEVMTNIILNPNRIELPKTNLLGKRMWMVTTSNDNVNVINKNKFLKEEGSNYKIPTPKNSKGFVNWYNSADGKYYNPGDIITVETGIYLEAIYK